MIKTYTEKHATYTSEKFLKDNTLDGIKIYSIENLNNINNKNNISTAILLNDSNIQNIRKKFLFFISVGYK